LRVVDSVNEWMGQAAKWLLLVLVIVVFYDIVVRYIFSIGTLWGYESAQMLGASVNVLGWGYVRLHRSHIRIDIFYNKFSEKSRVLCEVILTALIFFPVFTLFSIRAWEWMVNAWVQREIMLNSFWYPPAGPMRTILVVGLILLFLQFLAEFIRDIYFLKYGIYLHKQVLEVAEI